MEFNGSQVLIGKGAQAEVFRYQGYAYKVYKNIHIALPAFNSQSVN